MTTNEQLIEEERRFLQLESDIKSLTSKVETLESSISDLVTAWKTAGNLVTFIKWIAGLAIALTAIKVFFTTGILK